MGQTGEVKILWLIEHLDSLVCRIGIKLPVACHMEKTQKTNNETLSAFNSSFLDTPNKRLKGIQ